MLGGVIMIKRFLKDLPWLAVFLLILSIVLSPLDIDFLFLLVMVIIAYAQVILLRIAYKVFIKIFKLSEETQPQKTDHHENINPIKTENHENEDCFLLFMGASGCDRHHRLERDENIEHFFED